MAKTFRYLALTFFLLIGISSQGKQTEMTAINLASTSGTMVMRHVEASKATLSQDAQYLLTENLHMVVRMKDDKFLDATAAKGIVNLNGNREYGQQLVKDLSPFELLQEYGKDFTQIQYPGDFMLDGDGTLTKASMGDSGTIETEKLIWSDLMKSYLMPDHFNQAMTMEDGSVISIVGIGAIIDEELQHWMYYGNASQAVEMIYTNPGVSP